MGSQNPNPYFISRPENLRLSDVIKLLFSRGPLSTYQFIETPSESEDPKPISLIVIITLILEKILLLIDQPLHLLGNAIEFTLNLFALNGGVLGLLSSAITVSIKIPNKNSDSYHSIMGFIDSWLHSYYAASTTSISSSSSSLFLHGHMNNKMDVKDPIDLTMMASKIAYEDPAYIQSTVEKQWNMHFVKYFNCWNESHRANTTHAFICSDKPKDAQLIVLAFRGPEPSNGRDWATDPNLSWISTGKMGKVHMGFMKALGLTNDQDFSKGFPHESPKFHLFRPLAYYSIRDTLNELLKENPNAKLMVTGHSQGGALATLFPSLLLYHNQTTILNRLLHVFTYQQPKVGDDEFASFMASALMLRYRNMVYWYDDIVPPHIPSDPPQASHFKLFGYRLHYSSLFGTKEVNEEPNKDFFSLRYILSMCFNGVVDLVREYFAWLLKTCLDFMGSIVLMLFRLLGLFIPGFASHDLRDHVNIIGERLTKLIPSSVSVGPSIPGFGSHSIKDHVNIGGRLAKLIPTTSRVDPMGLVSSIAGRSHKCH